MWTWPPNSFIYCAFSFLIFIIILIFYGVEFKEILKAIPRGKAKIKFSNLSIDIDSSSPKISFGSQTPQNKEFEFSKAFQSHFITKEEMLIRDQLVKADLTYEKGIDILTYQLANKNAHIVMLQVDKTIYDEQVHLLAYLNQNGPTPEAALHKFHEDWRSKTKNDLTFESFTCFLLEHTLIIRNFSGICAIGPLGKEYLSFLIRVGSDKLKL